MANITAHFVADFTSFYDAVTQADVKLKTFEDDSNKVASSLSRMTNAFSGQKVIQDATLMVEAVERLGGASKLTEAELQRVGNTAAEAAAKMRALGMDVPDKLNQYAAAAKNAAESTSTLTQSWTQLTAGLTAANLITRGVEALVDFGVESLKSAAAVKDLAQKTGLSTDAIQEMQHVAALTGGQLETFTNGAFKLSATLAGGGASVEDAVRRLGLSFTELRQMAPEDQFKAIMTALGAVADQGERNRIGIALMGKAYRDMASAAQEGYDQIAAGTTKLTKEQIELADKMDDMWTAFWLRQKAQMAAQLISIGETVEKAKQLLHLSEAPPPPAPRTDIELTVPVFEDTMTPRLKAAQEAVRALTADQWKEIEVAKQLGAVNELLSEKYKFQADAIKLVNDKLNDEKKAQEEAAAEAKRRAKEYTDAMTELETAGDGWKGTLDTINGAVVEAAKHYLDAGVSAKALQTIWGLSDAQIKAITLSLKEDNDELAKQSKAVEEVSKLWNEYDRVTAEQGGTATDKAIAKINEWAGNLTAKMKQAGTDTKEFYDALAAVSQQRIDGVMVNWDELSKHSKATLEDIAARAKAMFDKAFANPDQYSPEYLKELEDAWRKAQKDVDDWGTTVDKNTDKAKKDISDTSDAVKKLGMTWSEAMDAVREGKGTMTTTVSGAYSADTYLRSLESLGLPRTLSASGIPAAEQTPQVVYGHYVGSTADTVINPISIQMVVNGTGEQVAKEIADYLTRTMKTGRKWPSA